VDPVLIFDGHDPGFTVESLPDEGGEQVVFTSTIPGGADEEIVLDHVVLEDLAKNERDVDVNELLVVDRTPPEIVALTTNRSVRVTTATAPSPPATRASVAPRSRRRARPSTAATSRAARACSRRARTSSTSTCAATPSTSWTV
jgi:hypothetical protein